MMSAFPIIIVTGARQVGKSTFLNNALAGKAEFVVFDPTTDVENARADPELFFRNHRTPLVLDEVQYAPEVLGPLKRRVDEDRRPGQYVLSGSQQWGVLRAAAESLAGRAAFLDLDGFSLAETSRPAGTRHWLHAWLENPRTFPPAAGLRLDPGFTLYERLWRGWLPEAHFLALERVPDFHLAYQRTYIERDVRLMADVSDVQLFGRFVRLAAALTAQEVNHSQLGRELGLTPATAARWLAILSSTFQWSELPAYSGNAIKRISKRPKGYFSDTGVVCAALAVSTPTALGSHPAWGAVFETAVFGELRKAISLMSPRPNLYYWRTHGGAEVDVLLERDGTFYPIEVKASSRVSRGDTSGISAFRKTCPQLRIAPGLVVAPTEKALWISPDDMAVPWDFYVE